MLFKRSLYTANDVAGILKMDTERVLDHIASGELETFHASHPRWPRVHYTALLRFIRERGIILPNELVEPAQPKVLWVGKTVFIPQCDVHTAVRITEVAAVLCEHVFDVVVLDQLTISAQDAALIARELVTDPFHGQPRIIHLVRSTQKVPVGDGQSIMLPMPFSVQELSKLCYKELGREFKQ
jgi:hypothetical protein